MKADLNSSYLAAGRFRIPHSQYCSSWANSIPKTFCCQDKVTRIADVKNEYTMHIISAIFFQPITRVIPEIIGIIEKVASTIQELQKLINTQNQVDIERMEKQSLDGTVADVTFACKYKANVGQAVYLVGELFDLGEWDITKAIKMKCHGHEVWLVKQYVPVNLDFEYKFLVSDYEQLNPKNIDWIGDKNLNMEINDSQEIENLKLTLMSFNLRYENKGDKNQFSWQNRRQNCLKLIQDSFPCVVGVQQALQLQRKFLADGLSSKYTYIGVPRDLHKGQECGIFVRKDRFLVLDSRFEWLSKSGNPGSVGYDAKLPRYCTCLVLIDLLSIKRNKLMVVNCHLDHQGKVARQMGIKLIVNRFREYQTKYEDLTDFYVMGDFNISENDKIFNCLKEAKNFKFNSLRQVSPQTCLSLTFNGFRSDWQQKIGDFFANQKLTIDHIFASSYNYVPKKFQVIKIQGKIISDHFPIMAELQLKQ